MSRIGWVGVGAMGAPMAARLADAGHEVSAFDVDSDRVALLAERGVARADSVAELASNCQVLALMVATPEQADDVLVGGGDAASALAPGSVVLLLATVGPIAAARFGEVLAERGVELVDAPVSGGVARAREGTLVAMVAGPGYPQVKPILELLAQSITVVGPAVGDAQKVKLVNQLLCGVHIAVAAEAMAFAEALGLDAGMVFDVVRHGAAASFMLEDRGQRMLAGEFGDVKSALDIFVKDMGLVTEAARAHDYPTPLASAAQLVYLAGRRAGLGRRDDSSVIEVLRAHTGARPA